MPWGWRLLCLWPGLARLWLRGDFQALGFAVFFSILLNLALVSSLIWPAYLGSRFLLVAWPLLAMVWLANAWLSWRWLPQRLQVGHKFAAPAELRVDTLFNQAQREYLRCHWAEAQGLLERRLRLRPRDVESRLLLASVLRRVGRFQLAVKELELLEGLDEARAWSLELSRERERLRLAQEPLAEEPLSKPGSEVVPPGDDLTATSAQELRTHLDEAFAVADPALVSELDEAVSTLDEASQNSDSGSSNGATSGEVESTELKLRHRAA